MTDVELVNFLEWLRKRYLLASLVSQPNPLLPDRKSSRLIVESIANQALVDEYRKSLTDH